MSNLVAAIVFATCYLGGLAIACWLVVNEHPWFALVVLILVGSLSVKTGERS
jgi:hypothetical protein